MSVSRNTPNTSPAPAALYPPRYWWLKRILLAVAIVLTLLGVCRWRWAVAAQRHLDAVVAEIQSRGEPLFAADFMRPPIPDDENAAYFLQQAARAMVIRDAGGFSLSRVRENPALLAQEEARVAALLTANSEALRLVRAAASRTAVNWNLDFSGGFFAAQRPSIRTHHDLGDVVVTAALYRLHEGRPDEAIEFVSDALRLSRAIDDGLRCDVHQHMLALEIQFDCVTVLERVAPLISSHASGATRALITQLLDEADLRTGWVDAMIAGRMIGFEYVRPAVGSFSQGPTTATPHTWSQRFEQLWFWPMWTNDAALMLLAQGRIAQAGLAANLDAATAELPAIPDADDKLAAHTRGFSVYWLPQHAECLPRLFEALARRRLVAARLALRLYEIDHGRLPSTLSELVPDYLPTVPLDPLVGDGRDIAYDPNDPAAVLSAGKDRLRVRVPLRPTPELRPRVDHQDDVERQDRQADQQQPADAHPQ